jgi:hypothetical protein
MADPRVRWMSSCSLPHMPLMPVTNEQTLQLQPYKHMAVYHDFDRLSLFYSLPHTIYISS